MTTVSSQAPASGLHAALDAALTSGDDGDLVRVAATPPTDPRDRVLTLLAIYDLHTAPIETLGDRVRLQHHPAVASLKQTLERQWLAELEAQPMPAGLDADPVAAMRALAARDRLPEVYKWLAKEASYDELVRFLEFEGGPDGGFDDLVAACQVGLAGSAKLELANNYWDEMGNGDGDAVHTVIHQRMAAALGVKALDRDQMPIEALERVALGGLFATNRWLQPEMLGALGLIELQAGPRCRLVLQGFDRLGAPRAAYPFYEIHADVDPRHGKDWVEKAIAPLAQERPEWAARMVKGAWWRSLVNAAFFRATAPAGVSQAA
jgi:hypothetical protein